MKWPWGKNITEIQAKEIGKFCLNLCQATLLGTFGIFYVNEMNVYIRVIIVLNGFISAILLFLLAIRLFEEGEQYEIYL